MELRWYQDSAVSAVFQFFAEREGSPLIVLPTGSGKSIVIAELIRRVLRDDRTERILILSHRAEILQQDHAEIRGLIPYISVGLYSAQLGFKQLKQVTVAGVQSLYRQKDIPPFGLVIVDEAHLISRKADGMYLTVLNRIREKCPTMRIVGATATPFRMQEGMLHEGEGRIFTDICYEAPLRQLMEEGYLSPLVTKHAETQADLSGVHRRGGEFIAKEAEEAMDDAELIRAACDEIVEQGRDRKSWLVFCAGIKHAEHVTEELRSRGIDVHSVFGHTPKDQRKRLLTGLQQGRIRALVNVDILTVGVNARNIDLIAMLRPTESVGLWHQIVGRGLRISPETGKENCKILDFCETSLRCGTLDNPIIRNRSTQANRSGEPAEPPIKVCPTCRSVLAVAVRSCLDCGFEFPIEQAKHSTRASTAGLFADEPEPPRPLPVTGVEYSLHVNDRRKPSMRVTYWSGIEQVSEWWAFERADLFGLRAANWWETRALVPGKPPITSDEAVRRAKRELKVPQVVMVRRKPGTKYLQVVGYRWEATQMRLVG